MWSTLFVIYLVCGIAVNIIMIGTDDTREQEELSRLSKINGKYVRRRREIERRQKELSKQLWNIRNDKYYCNSYLNRDLKRDEQAAWSEYQRLDKELLQISKEQEPILCPIERVENEINKKRDLLDKRWKFAIWPIVIVGIIVFGLVIYGLGLVWYFFCGGFIVCMGGGIFETLFLGLLSLILLAIFVGMIAILFGWNPPNL